MTPDFQTAVPSGNRRPARARAFVAAPDRQLVTASELVRHFGIWQERAARDPIYILHRGRPRHVLTSVEVMEALCATRDAADAPAGREAATLDALLDLTSDTLLIAGVDRGLIAASLPARLFFGGTVQPGMAIDRLFAPAQAPLLIDAIERVARSGVVETIDLVSPRHPDRRLDAEIAPLSDGIALRLTDTSLADELAGLRAGGRALETALAAATGLAMATINLRGYLAEFGETLSRLTGLGGETLANARFVSLFDIAARPVIGDAIERVIAGDVPTGLSATLLVNRGEAISVRVGLAPLRDGRAITGARAIIAMQAPKEPLPEA